MDRLRTMEVFLRVVELGSFTRAASALGLPRATVSAAVAELEARLGLQLLQRTTRRLALTPSGQAYIEEASRLLRELSELEQGLSGASRALAGRVRVDVPASAGRHVIAPALPELLAQHPGLLIELGSSDRPVDLIGEGVDCAIRGGELHDESLVARRLGVLPVITCAAPSYLERFGEPKHPSALDQHLFVGFFSPRTGRVFEVDFAHGEEQRSLRPRHQVAANDADTWLALAQAGCGLVQTPASRGVRELLRAGALRRVLPSWTVEPLPLTALYPRDRQLSARVRVFIDWVVELYKKECAEAAEFVG